MGSKWIVHLFKISKHLESWLFAEGNIESKIPEYNYRNEVTTRNDGYEMLFCKIVVYF